MKKVLMFVFTFLIISFIFPLTQVYAAVDVTSTAGWTPTFPANNQFDYVGDQQTGSNSGDIVGDTTHPCFFVKYDSVAGEIAFRIRVNDADGTHKDKFGNFAFVGVDADNNGGIDFFVGVYNPTENNGRIGIYNADPSKANTSPSTTGVINLPQREYSPVANQNYSLMTVNDSSSFSSNTDYFITFKVPVADINTTMISLGRNINITSSTPLRYIIGTAQQDNSFNVDIGGITQFSANDTTTWANLGVFSPTVTVDGQFTVTAGGSLAIAPANATEGATQTISLTYTPGEALANGTVVFTIPAGFTATTSDTVSIAGGNATGLAAGQITNAGQTVTITGVTATTAQTVVLTLTGKTVPAANTYSFSATADADGAGAAKTPSAGTVIEEIYLLNVFPDMDIRLIIFIEYITYYGGTTILTLFLRELYPEEFSKKIIRPMVGFASCFIFIVIVLPVEIYTRTINIYHLFVIASSAYFIVAVFQAVRRRRDGARLQLFGILFFIFTLLHDILYNWNMIRFISEQIVSLGLFVLIFVQAIVLARRFSNAFRTIETMSEKLLSLDRIKDEFLANTSHELKTPLHGIINILQSLLEGAAGEMNDVQRKNVSMVISIARRQANLINDILDFSRLKNSDVLLYKRGVDLHAVINANMEVFRYFIADKPVRLLLQLPGDLPDVYADENRLLQIRRRLNLIFSTIR